MAPRGMEPEGMTLAKLQKGVSLMLKIKEQCKRWGFTEETFVEIVEGETSSTPEEDGRAAILMNVMALSSSLCGIKPLQTLKDILGPAYCERIKMMRNSAGHEYSNIPGKNNVNYTEMWSFIDEDFPKIMDKLEEAIKEREPSTTATL